MAIFQQIGELGGRSLSSMPALVKATAFLAIWAIVWLPIAILVAQQLRWQPPLPLAPKQKLTLLASLYIIAPLILWGTAQIEGVSARDWGLYWHGGAIAGILAGLILGALSLALMFGGQWLLGWVQWQYPRQSQNGQAEANFATDAATILLPALAIGLLVSSIEELVFRGCLLQILQQDYPWAVAAIVSSLIFALLHLIWEQEATLPQLPGLWLMGIVLAIARLADGGSLALPIGLHAGWIWAIASLDGLQAISYTGKGSPWLTGIAGKPLAGGTAILLLLATGAMLWQLI